MIFYLSGTGNTKWVAESLARKLGEPLVDIAKEFDGEMKYTVADGEKVGFCFPVHGWRPPKLLLDFLHEMKIEGMHEKKTYCFIVCTAGDTVGEALSILEEELRKNSIILHSCWDVRMPNTYVGLPFMDVDSEKLAEKKVKEAQARVAYIGKMISREETGCHMLYEGKWPKTNSRVLGACFKKLLVTDKPFRVDAKKCIKCGKCVASCPVGNIAGGAGELPSWKHNGRCMTCFACYHSCPQHAIRYGVMMQWKGQYHGCGLPVEE